jgi:glycerophosphoryl diester phosphodiesterase
VTETPVVIAHRGGAKLRPENTRAAFEHALTCGVDAIECDVRLSRDGVPMVIHDETLDRTTDRRGPVAAFAADELGRVDAGYRFGPAEGFPFRAQGIGVPRLAEVLQLASDLPVVVEIKGDSLQATRAVLDVIDAARARERVVIGGFSHAVLAAVRAQAEDLLTSASQMEVISALRWSYLWRAPPRRAFQLIQAPLHLRGRRVLTRSLVRVWRKAGIPVQAWIVDEVEDMRRLLDWGVTGLITDRPDRAVAVIHERTQM